MPRTAVSQIDYAAQPPKPRTKNVFGSQLYTRGGGTDSLQKNAVLPTKVGFSPFPHESKQFPSAVSSFHKRFVAVHNLR